jgi:hypothetical protein
VAYFFAAVTPGNSITVVEQRLDWRDNIKRQNSSTDWKPMKPQDRVRLTDAACARRQGVCAKTLKRWEDDPDVAYPRAQIVRRRKYRWLDEILSWEQCNPDFRRSDAKEEGGES